MEDMSYLVSVYLYRIYSLELEKINQCDLNVFSTALDPKQIDVRVLTNCLKVNYYYGYFVMLNIALIVVSFKDIHQRTSKMLLFYFNVHFSHIPNFIKMQ